MITPILVTGGTGMIGYRLMRTLAEQGNSIRASFRRERSGSVPRFMHPLVTWIEGDLQDKKFCSDLCKSVGTVFHCAALRRNIEEHRNHAERFMEENIGMSRALTEALADEHSVQQLVFLSTANISPHASYAEILSGGDGYVAGKVAAEFLWQECASLRNLPLLILRPVGVYGPDDRFAEDSNVIPSLIIKAETHTDALRLWGDGTQRRSFLFVDDLVRAILLLLKHQVIGIQYVAPSEIVSVRELAAIIRDIVNPDLPIVCDDSKPMGQKAFPEFPHHPLLQTFPWTPLKEGLRRTYEEWKKMA